MDNVCVKTTKIRRCVLGGMLSFSLALSACGAGGQSVAEGQAPPADFASYEYPGGLFALSMPSDWVVNDISDASAVHVEFSPPGSPYARLIVFVVRLDEEPDDFDVIANLEILERLLELEEGRG